MADDIIVNRKYRIVRQIGVGGMGAVYEVEHVRLRHVRYALKQLKRELEHEKDLSDRFDKEAMRMAELQHPNIVRVYDIDVDPDFGAFILMDLIQGDNLGKIVREAGRRPLREVLRMGTEIASALDFAHGKGIVHRDIKPGNIMIENGTGRAVLTDFGIAKKIIKDSGDETDGTRTGVFIGTYRYASPEQMRNEDPDPRWDIYSFGIVLYEAFSGKRFLDGMAEGQIFAHVAYMPDWKPKLDFPESPPDVFQRVIEECLERDRERRIVNAAELGRRLQACFESAPAESIVSRPTSTGGGGVFPGVEPVPVERPPLAAETVSAATEIERYDARRAELRARAEERLGFLERLERAVEQMGLTGDWPNVDDVRESLGSIAELEDSSQYEEAMRRLEAVGERGTEVRQSMEQFIRQALSTGIGDARARWKDLGERAKPFVPAADAGVLARELATAEERLAAGDWTAGWQSLTSGRRVLDHAEEMAMRQARAKVDAALDQIRAEVAEIGKTGAAVPADIEPRAAGDAIGALIDAGRLAEADRQAAALVARAKQSAEEARKKSADSFAALQARVRDLAGRLDPELARAAAPEDVERARRATEEAAEAERGGDRRASVAALEVAARAYEAATAAVEAALERRAGELEQAVRAALTRAESVPAALVESASEGAKRSLGGARGADRRAAIAALETARAALDAALAEAPVYAEAEARRREAEAARERVASAGVAAREQRPAEAVMARAAAELKQRGWAAARDLYAEALQAWTALEAESRKRDAAARVRERRGAVEAQLRSLGELQGILGDTGLPVPDAVLREVDTGLKAIGDELAPEQAEAALARLGELAKRVDGARSEAVAGLRDFLTRESSALGEGWKALSSSAGRLLSDAERREIGASLETLERSGAAGEWAQAWRIAVELRARIERAGDAARAAALALVAKVEKDIEAGAAEIAAAGASPSFDTAAFGKRLRAIVGEGRLADAAAEADAAARELSGAIEKARRGAAEHLAEARRLAEAELAAVDAAAVRAVARAEIEGAERALAAARQAEKRAETKAATEGYEQARAAYAEARRLWSEEQQRRVQQLAQALRAAIRKAENAPAPVVGDALAAAQRTVDAAAKAEPAAAIADLTRWQQALERALADVAVFQAAERAGAEAEQVAARAAALPIPERDLKTARKMMEKAAAAFEAKRWTDAGEQYAEASKAWLALEAKGREIARAAEEEARRTRAAAQALQKLVDEIGKVPDEIAGDAPAAARALLAAGDASLEDLEEAHGRLEALRAELPLLRAAGEQRETAKAMEQRVLAMGAKKSHLKEPRRVMAEADALFAKRTWAQAGERYTAAVQSYTELAQKLRSGDVEVAKGGGLPTRQIAIAGGALLVVAVGVVAYLMRPTGESRPPAVQQQAKEQPRPQENVPPPAKPVPAEKPVEAKPPEVKPPEAAPLAVASAEPAGERLSLKEDAKQKFSVVVRGGAPGAKPSIDWYMDDARIVGDTDTWEYAPGFDAARGKPHRVEARVHAGGEQIVRDWEVDVEDVNRPPKVSDQLPAAKTVSKKIGDKVKLAVDAADDDGDTLQYDWTVDGKAAGGNAPSLELEVDRDHKVAVAVRDGKSGEPARAGWDIAAVKPDVVALALEASPKNLTKLAFQKAATFKLSPKGAAPPGVEYEWRVNGEKVAVSGPTFQFDNKDASLVRRKPVQIAAVARADGFSPFTYDWKVDIVPPPPEITGAVPSSPKISAQPGSAQTFEVTAAAPVGDQQLTYVFEANGKKTESNSPSFKLASTGDREVKVVASVKDNFGQRSREQSWTIASVAPPAPPVAPTVAPPSVPNVTGIESQVQAWLDQYRNAFNQKDIETLAVLLHLDAGKKKALGDALSKKQNLKVTLTNIQTSKLANGNAVVSYDQLEQFTDAGTGKTVSLPTSVKRTFRSQGASVQLESTQMN